VAVYRCYYLDSADRIASTDVIHCDTDAQARSRADIRSQWLSQHRSLGSCSDGLSRAEDRRADAYKMTLGYLEAAARADQLLEDGALVAAAT
jgi:hypothetical protein